MLKFTFHGGTSISLTNGKTTLQIFSPDAKTGDETLVLLSKPEEDPKPQVISWPGEYDISGIAIRGIGHDEGRIVSYAVEFEGIRCAFLCSPLCDWTDHELELLGDVDALVIPTDNPKTLQKLVDEIDPRVLIPLDTGGTDKHQESLKLCGALDKEEVSSYEIKGKSTLPSDGRDVVVLKAEK